MATCPCRRPGRADARSGECGRRDRSHRPPGRWPPPRGRSGCTGDRNSSSASADPDAGRCERVWTFVQTAARGYFAGLDKCPNGDERLIRQSGQMSRSDTRLSGGLGQMSRSCTRLSGGLGQMSRSTARLSGKLGRLSKNAERLSRMLGYLSRLSKSLSADYGQSDRRVSSHAKACGRLSKPLARQNRGGGQMSKACWRPREARCVDE